MRDNAHLVIAGERVRLVPYTSAHVERYHAWMQDEELLRLTCSEPLSLEEEQANQISWRDDPSKVTFIICALDDAAADPSDLTSGMCGDVNAFFSEIDVGDGEETVMLQAAELEIMIAEPTRRRGGLAREALQLFIHWLLGVKPSLERLVAKITDDNEPSRTLFEKSLGFTVYKHLAVFEQTELHLHADMARASCDERWRQLGAHTIALATGPMEGGHRPLQPLLNKDGDHRILVFSYEFTYSPFSGNGVLARSLVKGLLACGNRVVVICCKPAASHATKRDHHIEAPEVPPQHEAALTLEAVELPEASGWRRLDSNAAWQEYAAGAASLAPKLLASQFDATSALVIDWTGSAAWRAFRSAAWPAGGEDAPSSSSPPPPPPALYINFRVYSSGLSAGDDTERLCHFHDEEECHSLGAASHALALSTRDQQSLRSLLLPSSSSSASASLVEVGVLLPCLRGDMHALALQERAQLLESLPTAAAKAIEERRCLFLTCGVRLSSEKNPMLFAQLLESLGAEAIESRGLVPLLFGAAAEAEYASEVKARVRAASPSAVIVEDHLGPAEMAAIYAATALNLHPCLYDAYGMSIVEAAAFGAPSLVNGGGTIGATALLGGGTGCFEADLAAPIDAVALSVLEVLDERGKRDGVAAAAKAKALGWSEEAAGSEVHDHLVTITSRATAEASLGGTAAS